MAGRAKFACVAVFLRLFITSLGERALVSSHGQLRLATGWGPTPDLLVLEPRADAYRGKDIEPDDVLLLAEVLEEPAGDHREVRVPLYASAGIREVWLIDLPAGVIETYREPTPPGYRRVGRVRRDGVIASEAFPGLILVASALLG